MPFQTMSAAVFAQKVQEGQTEFGTYEISGHVNPDVLKGVTGKLRVGKMILDGPIPLSAGGTLHVSSLFVSGPLIT